MSSQTSYVQFTIHSSIKLLQWSKAVAKRMNWQNVISAFLLFPVHLNDFDFGDLHLMASFRWFRLCPWVVRYPVQHLNLSVCFWNGPYGTKVAPGLLSTIFMISFHRPRWPVSSFYELTRELSIPSAEEKTKEPTQKLKFLDVELDAVVLISRLSCQLADGLEDQVSRFLRKCKVKVQELEKLVRHLNFACKVIASG